MGPSVNQSGVRLGAGAPSGADAKKQPGAVTGIPDTSPSAWESLPPIDARMVAGVVAVGAALVPAVNLFQRDAALSAPSIGVGDILSQLNKLHERHELEVRLHELDQSLSQSATQSGSADTLAADRALRNELRCQLDYRVPEELFKISAVATLQSSKHVAGLFTNAADGEVFYYALSAPELGAHQVTLKTQQRLAPNDQKAAVLFATDLSRAQLIGGELILVPASMPNIVGIPGSGEAILEFHSLPK